MYSLEQYQRDAPARMHARQEWRRSESNRGPVRLQDADGNFSSPVVPPRLPRCRHPLGRLSITLSPPLSRRTVYSAKEGKRSSSGLSQGDDGVLSQAQLASWASGSSSASAPRTRSSLSARVGWRAPRMRSSRNMNAPCMSSTAFGSLMLPFSANAWPASP